jgi:hypothetical protein
VGFSRQANPIRGLGSDEETTTAGHSAGQNVGLANGNGASAGNATSPGGTSSVGGVASSGIDGVIGDTGGAAGSSSGGPSKGAISNGSQAGRDQEQSGDGINSLARQLLGEKLRCVAVCSADQLGIKDAIVAIASVPFPKSWVGMPQSLGSGPYTNAASAIGAKIAASNPALGKALRTSTPVLGTKSIPRMIGRAVPFVGLGFTYP